MVMFRGCADARRIRPGDVSAHRIVVVIRPVETKAARNERLLAIADAIAEELESAY
jgi:hypothetical protein